MEWEWNERWTYDMHGFAEEIDEVLVGEERGLRYEVEGEGEVEEGEGADEG
jgi:hypothetical protein